MRPTPTCGVVRRPQHPRPTKVMVTAGVLLALLSLAMVQSFDCLRRMVSSVAPGHWLDIQFARFVRGAWFGAGPTWDCRSADRRDHSTSAGELTCFDDHHSIVGEVPPRVVVADPLTVAEAWDVMSLEAAA